MSEDVFTEPSETTDSWTDVRMTDPEANEWDVDVVVAGGRVEFVDLRIRPTLLSDFVDCLVEDASDDQAREILQTVADRRGIELDPASTKSES